MDRRTLKTVYALDMDMTDFALLSESDSIRWQGPTLEEDDLPEGLFDLEFNGHFGASVFYSVEGDDDDWKIHAAMVTLIEDKLAAIRAFKDDPDG